MWCGSSTKFSLARKWLAKSEIAFEPPSSGYATVETQNRRTSMGY
jgi:hypothetical protein